MRNYRLSTLTALACIFAVVAVLAVGCGENKPTILSLSPSSGMAGTAMMITGIGFGEKQNGSSVQFGEFSGPVRSWSDTEIGIEIPARIKAGDYRVSVTINGSTSNEESYTLEGE